MTGVRACITGIGLMTPISIGVPETRLALRGAKKRISPISLFTVSPESRLPVGEIGRDFIQAGIPRTHHLALTAAQEAMGQSEGPPDAVVVGVTTGGMLKTEAHFKKGETTPSHFAYHGPGTVGEVLAEKLGCTGPVITVSTACSSGAAAIKIALEMLRTRQAKRVLVGGADALCRLTYYGFRSLQLLDPAGARPFDVNRRGMSLSEGAGMLLLEAGPREAGEDMGEILGAGLSCDAYHPSSPDPEGRGALRAMRAALEDADISPSAIDYVNLHGTGTIDNDRAEARALNGLFGDKMPPVSSVKGAMGHSLAAAGAIEAGIAALSIMDGVVPGTTGCSRPDPQLGLDPVLQPVEADVETVLSNAFGFGGNNASVVIGRGDTGRLKETRETLPSLTVVGSACITGAGDMETSIRAVSEKGMCRGVLPMNELPLNLPSQMVRRWRRLTRMALSLGISAHKDARLPKDPFSIFFATGWGPLSETYGFLERLRFREESFSSPTAFVGSVHNAPAGQMAIHFGSTGPNVTVTGGDYSFEQALMVAGLMIKPYHTPTIVVGADAFHDPLSGIFDRSVIGHEEAADGGGGLCVMGTAHPSGTTIATRFFENSKNNPSILRALIQRLGGPERVRDAYGAVFAGIPGAFTKDGRDQLRTFCREAGFEGPVIDYRRFTGQFASASAVAAALGVRFVQDGKIPQGFAQTDVVGLDGKGVLMVGFGRFITAVEIISGG
ncbi:MAG: beta-ketoacyl synthase N-terminal-like domain-containing protein [Deltaproteobacteria bacterium]|nr:beta-ketoacyl synthase N-terminal-like domain-containing protein [Deltaproteobacteria bacterium]